MPSTRRSFLSLLSLLPLPAGAVSLSSLFSGVEEADVIVVGCGGAGLAAAVEAADRGASVIALEKADEIGGNTLISGGFYASVDPERQKPLGISDSLELFYSQTYENGGRKGDPKLIRKMVDGAGPSLKWLESLGMRFHKEVFELYGSHWPRCHTPVLPLGQGFIRTLSSAALERRVRIETGVQVIDFAVENGKVARVVALAHGKKKEYRAKKGIVVASGSYLSNSDLVRKFAPNLAGLTTNNTKASTGEAMMAAHKIGAALRDMESVQCLPGCPSGKKYRVRFHNDVSHFVLINKEGKRFIREDATRAEVRDAVLALPDHFAFAVIDSRAFKAAGILVRKEAVKAMEGGEAWKGRTLRDLALKMGVDPENFERTIAQYNQGVAERKDRFGKVIHDLTIPIKEPPFWASYAGMTLHYPEGGLAIDENARCLTETGHPIPGLYAAGAVTGGVHGNNRLGANGLADAIVFGRIAGKNAAAGSEE